MQAPSKRDWQRQNRKLQNQANIELYLSDDLWAGYTGKRRPGGVVQYSEGVIEACLLLRTLFGLGLRQTQGLMESLLRARGITCNVPNYTTLCRRAKALKVDLQTKVQEYRTGGRIIAIDSTGLSLLSSDSWNRHKHKRKDGDQDTPRKSGNQTWHKLHLAIDTDTGDILACTDTPANVQDCEVLPRLIEALPKDKPIEAVTLDMAYDTLACRKAIDAINARQLIPPKAGSVPSRERDKAYSEEERRVLRQRDDAIEYMRANSINGCERAARKRWKALVGYHRRSLVETTMWRMKAHTGTVMKSKLPETKSTECMLRCKVLNIANHA